MLYLLQGRNRRFGGSRKTGDGSKKEKSEVGRPETEVNNRIMDITEAKRLFEQNELNEAIEMLNEIISVNPFEIQALLLRARIYYKIQQWGNAINDYCSVLEIEPENQEAKSGVEMAENILGYFTPDMFNP